MEQPVYYVTEHSYNGRALAGGISLPADMWEALRMRAKAEDRAVSRIVRRALIRELAAPQEQLARNEREAAS